LTVSENASWWSPAAASDSTSFPTDLKWPEQRGRSKTIPPAETVCFVGDEYAVVHSGNGRLFLIESRQMQIVEEIIIRGHELRPIRELYPNLQRDLAPCSDLSTFMPPSGGFLSVHQELPSKSIADWRDQLLTWKIPYA